MDDPEKLMDLGLRALKRENEFVATTPPQFKPGEGIVADYED